MSTISLRLPESLHAQARPLAEQEGISIKQLIATSLAEKMSALLTSDSLRRLSGYVPELTLAFEECRGTAFL
jgi:hypothetical protein